MSKENRRQKSKARRIIGGFFRWFFLMLFALILVSVIVVWINIRRIVADAPKLDAMMVSPTAAATYICDAQGNRVQKLTLPEANRDLVTIDHIPEDLQHAFVAIEDSRFYTHNGIDLQGIVRAGIRGILRGSFSEGAGTITQQLLKNAVFTDWTTETGFTQRLNRKIQEQYLALQLEKMLTKEQILEDYLNTINLGAGCYGVQAAAFKYFGKDVSELTLSECAVIAAITQNPTRYNPLTNPEENKKRRKAVLDRMLKQHFIMQERYDEAIADDDVYNRIQSNEALENETSSIYTWYQDALIDQVLQDLMSEKGYTYKQAYKAVYTGGLRIYSAQDAAIQKICDEEFENDANFPATISYGLDYALSIQHPDGEVIHYGNEHLRSFVREADPSAGDWVDPSFNMLFTTAEQAKEAAAAFREATVLEGDTVLGERITITPQPQASLVIMDQATGFVKALVGGRGTKEASLTLNRATYTTRQPGSTFKILAAFAPAIDACGKTLATTYRNRDFYYSDGTKVSNWDVSDYSDTATIREAIVRSINVVAAECITEITPELGYKYAKAFGISTLTDHYETGGAVLSDVIAPLALGGVTKGVTDLDLCGAYACIANQGSYRKPTFYTRVEDHQGNVILDATSVPGRTVIKDTTAALLTDAMIDVVEDERGTAHAEIDMGAMPVAGKTGTTSDYRDIWFAGYTPYYTCSIWGGYDNNAVLPDEGETGIGHTYVKVLWNSIMNRIHEGLTPVAFPATSQVIRMQICKATGGAATEKCPDTIYELFALGTQPVSYCSVHGSGGLVTGMAGLGSAGTPGPVGSIFEGEDPSALGGDTVTTTGTAGGATAGTAGGATGLVDATGTAGAAGNMGTAGAAGNMGTADTTGTTGTFGTTGTAATADAAGVAGTPATSQTGQDDIVIYTTDQASIPAADNGATTPDQTQTWNTDWSQPENTNWDQPENNIQADPTDQYTFNEAPEIVIIN